MPIRRIGLLLLVALSILAGRAEDVFSATRFAGAYSGTFSSSCGDGTFALLAYPDGRVIFLASVSNGSGLVEQRSNEHADANGALQITGFMGLNATIQATLADGEVDGSIAGPSCTGAISGAKKPAEGILLELGGYYTGSTEGTVRFTFCLDPVFFLLDCSIDRIASEVVATYKGNLFSIMRADGRGYFLFERTEFTIVPSMVSSVNEVESVAHFFQIHFFNGTYGIDCRDFIDIVINGFFPSGCHATGGWFLTGALDDQNLTLTGNLTLDGSFLNFASGSYQLVRAVALPNNPPVGAIKSMPWLNLLLGD